MIREDEPAATRSRLTIGGAAAAIAMVALVAALLARSGSAASARYVVDDRVGATHLSAGQVESVVLARLAAMGTPADARQISRMTVLQMSMVPTIEARAGAPPSDSPDANDVVWVVRAEGHFVGQRVPPGAQPIVASTGYFVVDDATGETIGMGMP